MISIRIRESPCKKRLAELEEGTKVKIRGPDGEFILHQDYSKPAVFLSGGINVMPFRSMTKYTPDKQISLEITVFDSNKNINNILYKKEFDDWANKNKNLKIIYSITEDNPQERIRFEEFTGY
jgi:glycine betaine catabolism B